MLFKKGSRRSSAQLESDVHDLLMRAEADRTPGADAAALNSAGDLYNEAGDSQQAQSYYGLAIDAYLKADRWDSAGAVCRKVLRLSPNCVRSRCTLAWLAIGKGLADEAQAQIRGYASAAKRAGREALAIAQLKRMGDAAQGAVRETVAEQLKNLGANQAADYLFSICSKEATTSKIQVADELLWPTVRRAALLGPSDLARA
jgi:hypothetical protein